MIKTLSKKLCALLLAAGVATAISAQAQTLVDVFSYSGGGLSPASYTPPNQYQPANLTPDVGADAGGNITYSGMTSGGLGSSGFPDGYGGIYTFFSSPSFSFETSDVLIGVQTITISFLSGGGDLAGFNASAVTLDYNLAGQGLTTSSFTKVNVGNVETPIGPTAMNLYTWTWDVSDLGSSTGFDLNWASTGQHSFFDQITVTQAVPEPSTYVLIGLGLVTVVFLRKRLRQGTSF